MKLEGLFKNKKGFSDATIIGFAEDVGVVKYQINKSGVIKTATVEHFLAKYDAYATPNSSGGGLKLSTYNLLVKLGGGNSWMPVAKIARTEQEAVSLAEDEFEDVTETQVIGFSDFGSVSSGINLSLT